MDIKRTREETRRAIAIGVTPAYPLNAASDYFEPTCNRDNQMVSYVDDKQVTIGTAWTPNFRGSNGGDSSLGLSPVQGRQLAIEKVAPQALNPIMNLREQDGDLTREGRSGGPRASGCRSFCLCAVAPGDGLAEGWVSLVPVGQCLVGMARRKELCVPPREAYQLQADREPVGRETGGDR